MTINNLSDVISFTSDEQAEYLMGISISGKSEDAPIAPTSESTTIVNNNSELNMAGVEILKGIAILCGCLLMLSATVAGCVAIFKFVF